LDKISFFFDCFEIFEVEQIGANACLNGIFVCHREKEKREIEKDGRERKGG
jgi:hypothetical protein